MIDPRIKAAIPFSETELAEIEQVLGRELPSDYREFARTYGGAFVGGYVDGNPELPILTFFKAAVVLAKLRFHTDFKNDGVLPVADCELGNLYVIDRENVVHYINYYGGQTTARKVTSSFSDLIKRLVVIDE